MIYIAADHRGFEIKKQIIDFLQSQSYQVEDLGAFTLNPEDDYPDYAFNLGSKVVDQNAKGILLCGSGVGVSVAANKVKGVRAGAVETVEQAIKARTDDDINILVLDAMTFDQSKDFEIIRTFLTTDFSGAERHVRRIGKIKEYEEKS